MSVFYPTQIGGFINATNSAATSTIGVADLPPGTKVFNVAVGKYFTLTVSTDSLVTDQVLAVSGISGLRWIVDQSGGSVTTNATLSGDGSGTPLGVVSAPAPTNAATFTAALNAATEALQGMVPPDQFSSMLKAAAHLGDASVTITPGASKRSIYVVPPATFTADRTIKIGSAGAASGDSFYLVIQDVGNHTITITNNADAVLVAPNGSAIGAPKRYLFYFTTDWNFFLSAWTV